VVSCLIFSILNAKTTRKLHVLNRTDMKCACQCVFGSWYTNYRILADLLEWYWTAVGEKLGKSRAQISCGVDIYVACAGPLAHTPLVGTRRLAPWLDLFVKTFSALRVRRGWSPISELGDNQIYFLFILLLLTFSCMQHPR
jgi:hypothetical protein